MAGRQSTATHVVRAMCLCAAAPLTFLLGLLGQQHQHRHGRAFSTKPPFPPDNSLAGAVVDGRGGVVVV